MYARSDETGEQLKLNVVSVENFFIYLESTLSKYLSVLGLCHKILDR